jgi:hypothetical protein
MAECDSGFGSERQDDVTAGVWEGRCDERLPSSEWEKRLGRRIAGLHFPWQYQTCTCLPPVHVVPLRFDDISEQ